MCVGKNTSQAANVRVVRFSGQRVRCSGLQKIVGKGSAFFDKLGQGQSPCPTLGAVIGAYKSITTKRVNERMGTPGSKLWQFRFYDHVIRDDNDFLTKWNYIDINPARRGEEYSEG